LKWWLTYLNDQKLDIEELERKLLCVLWSEHIRNWLFSCTRS